MADPDTAWEYAERTFASRDVLESFERLARYRPAVFEGYVSLRQAAFGGGALSSKEKELIVLAIEVARCKTNPPPISHARKAIDAGATPAEIAEMLSIVLTITGMLTFQESGRFVLEAAEQYHASLRPT